MKKEYIIYSLWQDGIVFYVGVTSRVKIRLRAHKKSYGTDIQLKEEDKYFGTVSTAYLLEQFWIGKYRDLGVLLTNKNASASHVEPCKNCGKDIIQTSGKRPRVFCDSTCRSTYWQRNKRNSGPGPKRRQGRPTKKSSK